MSELRRSAGACRASGFPNSACLGTALAILGASTHEHSEDILASIPISLIREGFVRRAGAVLKWKLVSFQVQRPKLLDDESC